MSNSAVTATRTFTFTSGGAMRSGGGRWTSAACPTTTTGVANSTAAEYDPAEGVFRVRYAQKRTKEPGVLELRGLERVTFSKYEPAEA